MICKIRHINGVPQYGIASNGKKSLLYEALKSYNIGNLELFKDVLGLDKKTDEDILKNFRGYLYNSIVGLTTPNTKLDKNGEPVVLVQDDVYVIIKDEKHGIFSGKVEPYQKNTISAQIPVIPSTPIDLSFKVDPSSPLEAGDLVTGEIIDDKQNVGVITKVNKTKVTIRGASKTYILPYNVVLTSTKRISRFPVINGIVVTNKNLFEESGNIHEGELDINDIKRNNRGLEFFISDKPYPEHPNVIVLENPVANDLYKHMNKNQYVVITGSRVLDPTYRREILNYMRRDFGTNLRTQITNERSSRLEMNEIYQLIDLEINASDEKYHHYEFADLDYVTAMGKNFLDPRNDGITHYDVDGFNEFTNMFSYVEENPFTYEGESYRSLAHALTAELYSEALNNNPGMRNKLMSLNPNELTSFKKWMSTKIKPNTKINEDVAVEMIVAAIKANSELHSFVMATPMRFTYSDHNNRWSRLIPKAIGKIQKRMKQDIVQLFNSVPDLAKYGTVSDYQNYLDSIFPDSQIKDIVYHGTMFDSFDKDSKFRGGVSYFTDNKQYAELVGMSSYFGPKRNLIPVILNITNPFYAQRPLADVPFEIHQEGKFIAPRVIKSMENNEYDSVVGVDAGQDKGYTIAIFNSDQAHIVGSKQDVKGFKNYMKEKNKPKEQPKIKEYKNFDNIKGDIFMAFKNGEDGMFFKLDIVNALGNDINSLDAIMAGYRTRTTRTGRFFEKYPYLRDLKPGDKVRFRDQNRSVIVTVTATYGASDPRWTGNWYKEGWIDSNMKNITGTNYTNEGMVIEFELYTPRTYDYMQTPSEVQIPDDNPLFQDCNKIKAKKGLSTSFTKGGTWTQVKDLQGYPTHEDGGVDLTISKDGVKIKNNDSEFKAEFGLVIPNNLK